MTDRMHRWVVSLHEAGHVVCGMVYDPETVRSAQLTPDGRRGLALQPVSLSDRQQAIFAAAGACAERYATRWPVPRSKSQKPTAPQSVAAMREQAVGQVFGDHATEFFKKRGHVCDAEHVGFYAVRLHPSDPSEWPADVRRVQADALRLVRRHKAMLRQIATGLFQTGFYFVPASAGANVHTETPKIGDPK